jgi:hypothetical protein
LGEQDPLTLLVEEGLKVLRGEKPDVKRVSESIAAKLPLMLSDLSMARAKRRYVNIYISKLREASSIVASRSIEVAEVREAALRLVRDYVAGLIIASETCIPIVIRGRGLHVKCASLREAIGYFLIGNGSPLKLSKLEGNVTA